MGSRGVKREAPRSSVTTLINSSVGVVALAMPYCFKQCGIVLSIVFLLFSAVTCTLACDLLISLCLSHKVSSLEKTCFRHLGILGKLVAELSIIGLMVGSIIGYNVSLADLGSDVALKIYQNLPSQHFRLIVLVFLTALIAPLCLMSKVQSFAKLSACAMFFYSFMILHMIFSLGVPKLIHALPFQHTVWWRTAGIIQCAPIFFASIFCQTQLHTIYAGLQQPSVREMRRVVRLAVIILTLAYGLFGFFGYLAFADADEIPGNVFLMYPENLLTFCVKAGFLFTVSVSIPLTMFPLRQSIESFLFHRGPSLTSDLEFASDGLQPPTRRFRSTTLCLIILCFLLSLTTDKIVLIIQLTSSLAGSLIGYILPALAAIYAFTHHRDSKERRIGGCLLFVGISILVIGLISVHQIQPSTSSGSNSIEDSVIGAINQHVALEDVGMDDPEVERGFVAAPPLARAKSFDKHAHFSESKTPAPNASPNDVHREIKANQAANDFRPELKSAASVDEPPRPYVIPAKLSQMVDPSLVHPKRVMAPEPAKSPGDSIPKLDETSNERKNVSLSNSPTPQKSYQPPVGVLAPDDPLIPVTIAVEVNKLPTEANVRIQAAANEPTSKGVVEDTKPHHPQTLIQNTSGLSVIDAAEKSVPLHPFPLDAVKERSKIVVKGTLNLPSEIRNNSMDNSTESLLKQPHLAKFDSPAHLPVP